MGSAVLPKGSVVLVNGVAFTLGEDVSTINDIELMVHALKQEPLRNIQLAINAIMDAQQELLKINGCWVKEVIPGYERASKLRTIETTAKLDAAKIKLDELWETFKNQKPAIIQA